SLRAWRSVIGFGAYDTARSTLLTLYEQLPYLILGRVLNAGDVGLYHRASLVCRLPDRVLLAGVGGGVLPVFGLHHRTGRSLVESYLRTVEHITAVRWPAALLMVVLAHPFVLSLLGSQWLAIVPLVQIMTVARLCAFTASIDFPLLVAAGYVRHGFWLTFMQLSVSLFVVTLAAFHGLHALALSTLLPVPFNIALSLYLVGAKIGLQWCELLAAIRKSAVVAASSAVGPLVVVLIAGSSSSISIVGAMLALLYSAIGWLSALWLTGHPLLFEIGKAYN